jgi:hypothetical protein
VSVVVEVSARKFEIPPVCACCGEAAEGEVKAAFTRRTGVRVIKEDTRSLPFPYCQACLTHMARWRSAASAGSWLLLVAGIATVVLCVKVMPVVGFAVFAVAVVLRAVMRSRARTIVRAQLKPSCACPTVAVAYLGWSGTVSSFAFDSDAYATRFAHGNRGKLVNVSTELRQLMAQGGVPRIQAAQRSAPAQIAAPPADHRVLDWIAKIEDFKGAEARRSALQRALAEIAEPRARYELLGAAGRIEVSAALDKIESLSTTAAKRRHLQKAIDDLRASQLPPELQAPHIGELEARLRALPS